MIERTSDLSVVVDWTSEEPVYEQIARQIGEAIAAGRLRAGSLLPPVRTLASDLGVNLNTVARGYRLLEENGFVRIRHRSGVEVIAPPSEVGAAARARFEADLRALLARGRQAGLSRDEMKRLVDRAIASIDW